MNDIRIGDFIQASGTSYCAIVIGEGMLRAIPVWKVRGPHGEASIIPKSQAIFIAPDWEAELEEKGFITRW